MTITLEFRLGDRVLARLPMDGVEDGDTISVDVTNVQTEKGEPVITDWHYVALNHKGSK